MRGVLEQIVGAPAGRRRGHTRRDPALHEAVLAEQRSLQQPHRPQVRADVHAARRSPRRRKAAAQPARRFATAAGRVARPDADAAAAACSSTRRSIRWSRNKTPAAGKDILQASANNLYVGVVDGGPQGLQREVRPQLAPGEAERQAGRGGLQGRRPLRRSRSPRSSGTSRRRSRSPPSRWPRRWPGPGHSGTGPAKRPIARSTTSPGSRTRHSPVDTINGFIEVYLDRARHQGRRGRRWSSTSTRRRRRASRSWRDERAVVRGPHAVGPEVPQAGRAGHCRQRHRRRGRDGRLRPDHADWHQPAERPGDPREVRQQVGVAVERQRGLRQVDAGRRCAASSRGRRRRRSAPPSAARSAARAAPPTCTR